jgi:acetyltransferase-like isoleucine patch superfamily enzyme
MGGMIVGKYTYGSPIRKGDMNTVIIGKYCSIAGCTLDCGWQHNTKLVTTYPFNQLFNGFSDIKTHPVCKGDIIIGNDVWIGEDCIINSNVTIGDGAVIGSRSIVTKDIEPYSVVAGSPAKFIRKRFSDEQIEELLKIKW